jgi:O-antigen ligase
MIVHVDSQRARKIADGFAVAAVAAIPWSTSAIYIFVAAWLIAFLPTVRADEVRDTLRHPAAWLPVFLVALAAVGMLWAQEPWSERFGGFAAFFKLLTIPVLLVQFRHSDRVHWVLLGFLASCTILLLVSYVGIGLGYRFKAPGVPVRDRIAQSGEFILCAAGLFYVGMAYWSQRRTTLMMGVLSLAGLFLISVLYVSASRTALVTVPLLFILYAITQSRPAQMAAIVAAIAVVGGIVWVSSANVQQRVLSVFSEVEDHGAKPTSSGQRLEFWRQSLKIMQDAPVIGHGTGSVKAKFAEVAASEKSSERPTVNPHNQTFMVGIQLGFIGVLALFAMWIAHFTLFVRGVGLVSWIGLVVVTQNVVGGLFNTHLFDVVQGWIYYFGVGAAGGWMLKHSRDLAEPAAAADKLPA